MKPEESLQKMYVEFQMINQQIKQLENQSTALNNQLLELMSTNQSLDEIDKVKENSEILVPLSTGIYARAQLKNSNSFIVNIGANVAMDKDLNATKEVIQEQVMEIRKLQESLMNELQTHTQKSSSLELEMNKLASTIKQ
jgi:prefoldin alpha subunit